MKKLLLVERNSPFQSIYTINFMAYLGLDVIKKDSLEEALAYLSGGADDIEMVVSRSVIEGKQTANAICTYIKEEKLNVPVIALGQTQDSLADTTILASGLALKSLMSTSARKMNITAHDMAALSVPDYYPIDLSFFKLIKDVPTDVYLLDNSGKYVDTELAHFYDSSRINSFEANGVRELFVKKNDRLKAVDHITNYIVTNIDANSLNQSEKVDFAKVSHGLVAEKLAQAGLTPETVKLAKKAMNASISVAKKSKSMRSLLKDLFRNKDSYRYVHSQLLTYLGIYIMRNLEWGNSDLESKFSFVSFFHDIALTSDELARIHTTEDLKKSDFTFEEKELIKDHAKIAAGFMMKFPGAPAGSDSIIRQHHGMMNGEGFNTHVPGNISPVACVFMVAETMADYLLSAGDIIDKDAIIEKMRQKYSTARFKRVIKILEMLPMA